MTDARLRQLERRAPGGGPAERARLLRERVRAGELSPIQLRLAACLGDPGARRALPAADARSPAADPTDLTGWGRALEGFGTDVAVRVAVAGADVALTRWEAWEPVRFAPGDAPRAAVVALDAWRLAPSAQALVRLATAVDTADRAVDGAGHLLAVLDQEHPGVVRRNAWRAVDAGWAAVSAVRAAGRYLPDPTGIASPSVDLGRALSEAGRALEDDARVAEAVEEALLPWVLAGPAWRGDAARRTRRA